MTNKIVRVKNSIAKKKHSIFKKSDYFCCAQCGCDMFIDKGIVDFADTKFIALECENCHNHSLIHTNEYDYSAIDSDSTVKSLSFNKF